MTTGKTMKVGDKIRLVDVSELEEYDVEVGMEGMANNLVSLPGEGQFVFFMPEGGREQIVMHSHRFEVIGEYSGSDLP